MHFLQVLLVDPLRLSDQYVTVSFSLAHAGMAQLIEAKCRTCLCHFFLSFIFGAVSTVAIMY